MTTIQKLFSLFSICVASLNGLVAFCYLDGIFELFLDYVCEAGRR